jgi:mannosyltransferase OCH1-like enzyme
MLSLHLSSPIATHQTKLATNLHVLPPSSGSSIIPRIIHQTWDTQDIPQDLAPWVKTWKQHNPDWEYWFWTPIEVEHLLQEKYPEYLELYYSYNYNVFRSDMMRYFIMDSFGGFYADMDMDCLKPLDPWIYRHSCLVSYEPYEHPYFGFNRTKPNVMTTILASRPGHLYWKMLINALPDAFRKYRDDVQLSTGPLFMDANLRLFNDSQSGYVGVVASLDKVTSELSDVNSITILEPKYFLPTYDPIIERQIRTGCKTLRTRDQYLLDVCDRLRNNVRNAPGEESFTNHHWVHMFLTEAKWRQKTTISVFDVIPDARVYKSGMDH